MGCGVVCTSGQKLYMVTCLWWPFTLSVTHCLPWEGGQQEFVSRQRGAADKVCPLKRQHLYGLSWYLSFLCNFILSFFDVLFIVCLPLFQLSIVGNWTPFPPSFIPFMILYAAREVNWFLCILFVTLYGFVWSLCLDVILIIYILVSVWRCK